MREAPSARARGETSAGRASRRRRAARETFSVVFSVPFVAMRPSLVAVLVFTVSNASATTTDDAIQAAIHSALEPLNARMRALEEELASCHCRTPLGEQQHRRRALEAAVDDGASAIITLQGGTDSTHNITASASGLRIGIDGVGNVATVDAEGLDVAGRLMADSIATAGTSQLSGTVKVHKTGYAQLSLLSTDAGGANILLDGASGTYGGGDYSYIEHTPAGELHLIQDSATAGSHNKLRIGTEGRTGDLTVSSSGYVGIGTSDPQDTLSVAGNIAATGSLRGRNFFTIEFTGPGGDGPMHQDHTILSFLSVPYKGLTGSVSYVCHTRGQANGIGNDARGAAGVAHFVIANSTYHGDGEIEKHVHNGDAYIFFDSSNNLVRQVVKWQQCTMAVMRFDKNEDFL